MLYFVPVNAISGWTLAQARELQEQQKQRALDAARLMVEEKRYVGLCSMTLRTKFLLDHFLISSACTEHDTLDLHGLTVAEACVIVQEAINASPPSLGSRSQALLLPGRLLLSVSALAQPLKIITGRGRHSVGHIGVLGPAVKEMLRAEGWHVKKKDGELIVRERS